MTATSPTAAQYSQATGRPAGNRYGARSDGDPDGFGKIMSASGQAKVGSGHEADDDGRDARIGGTDKLADSHEVGGDAHVKSKSDVDGHGRDETSSERDDPRQAALVILPLLTAELRDAGRRAAKGADQAGTDIHAAARGASRAAIVETTDTPSGDAMPVGRLEALVRQIESTGAEAPRGPFGKALQANLGAMPAERLSRAGGGDGENRGTGKDAGEPAKLSREAPTAGIDPHASTEPRAERQAARESRDGKNDPARHEAEAAEGRSPAGTDKPALPNGAVAALSTGSPIVQAAVSAPGWATALRRAATVMPGTAGAGAPVEALKIQLHPAELGMVTANLRIADGQLSIEIDVDTPEAYLKLSSERDAISKALRSTGMAVDNVTINLPPAHQPAAARDPNGMLGGGQNLARQDFQGSGTFGQPGNNGNAGRETSGDSRHSHDHIAPTEIRPDGTAAGGRVYI
jgi:chemotaxis protein MotD